MSRCLYNSSFEKFITTDENSIFGALPEYYDGTYQYLKSLGIEEI